MAEASEVKDSLRGPPVDGSGRRKVAIFADYDSCFDVVNPLIQDRPAFQKYSRAFFQHHQVLEKRDAAVQLLETFLDGITKDSIVYLFVGSNRQSLAFDKILGSSAGGFEAIGGGAFEAIAQERGWVLNYALLADKGPEGMSRWSKDTEGSAWNDINLRQPIEPGDSKSKASDDKVLKLMIIENNFRQLTEEFGEVHCYFFDDRVEFLDYTREKAKVPAHINFYTVRWDFMGYIIDGWTEASHPLVAKKAERSARD